MSGSTIDRLLSKLDGVKRSGDGFSARCPGHEDQRNSLSIKEGDDKRVLLKCFAGCEIERVVETLGLTMFDLFEKASPQLVEPNGVRKRDRTKGKRTRFEIRNLEGVLIAVHMRFDYPGRTKQMWWEQPNGKNGLDGLETPALPLFGAETLSALSDGAEVVVTEGELAAKALHDLKIEAVGTVTGASTTPNDDALIPLVRMKVVLWPDNDQAGRKHMASVAARLLALGCLEVRQLQWVEAPEKGDAVDALASNIEVRQLIADSSVWEPLEQSGGGIEDLGPLSVRVVGHNIPPEEHEVNWGPLQELPSIRPPVPSLPTEMVPEPLCPWLLDVAERACAPLEMIACPAIVSLGALVGRKLGIRPSEFDDYLVVPNLWGGIIARPGFMKTHDVEQGTAHLRRLAAIAHDNFEAEREEMEAHRDRIEAEIAATKEEMKKASKKHGDLNELEQHLADLKRDLRDAQVVERRYLTQDATVEKLGELLKENSNGLLVLRDELAGWLRTFDKPGREGDREFYLEAWNGTGGYTVDRIGRGTVLIPAVCLSIFGGIQPGKLNRYIQEAVTESGGADGLLQRLQITVWPDSLGEWKKSTSWPDTDAKNRAFEIFQYIDNFDPANLGANTEDGSTPFLRFTREAQALFDKWRDELEIRLRSDELASTPAFESHLSKYRSLMPSLALLFHLINHAAEAVAKTCETFATSLPDHSPSYLLRGVSLEAAQMAAAWCDYLELHARKIYATELYPGVEVAHNLADKIKQGAVVDGQSTRDIYQHHWSGLGTAGHVAAALEVLIESGWVRVEVVDTPGRPAERLRIHPDLRGNRDE